LIVSRYLRNAIDSATAWLRMHVTNFSLKIKDVFQSMIWIPGITLKEGRKEGREGGRDKAGKEEGRKEGRECSLEGK
jgi:hypothetical protein